MLSKIAIASLLVSAACAVPFPSFIDDYSSIPELPASIFTTKKPDGGNFMPGDQMKVNDTAPAESLDEGALIRRAKGQRVNNRGLANYNNRNIKDGVGSGVDNYKMYWGDGSPGQGWPAKNRWVSFENMWNNYKPLMLQSCRWHTPAQRDNSAVENRAIFDGIQKAADATGVDHRFILAIVMQESFGCVRTKTTSWGVRNPGLMQSHNGRGTCNDNGRVQNPCPTSTIFEMISDGTAGTDSGDGLANCINKAGRGDVAAFYRAARIYNSGSISRTGKLQDGIATHCYASDVANRLTGWVKAPSKCNCDRNPGSCNITPN